MGSKSWRGWLPPRAATGHKGDYGHVLVVAGSRGMMGAARLCALGALRAGAGLVTMAVSDSECAGAAKGPWEAMGLPLPSHAGAFHPRGARKILTFVRERRVTAVALGPGLSTVSGASRFALALMSRLELPLVVDADALNALAKAPRLLPHPRAELQGRWAPQGGEGPLRRAPWVLTPHPGEAGRLLKTSTARVSSDRVKAAREMARRFGAVSVLKGARTLVTQGDRIFVNKTGNPGMASGGMGDVLTGVIAGLIGQVRSSSPEEACLRAAILGVYLHGMAGDRAARDVGPRGILATDVANGIPSALNEFS